MSIDTNTMDVLNFFTVTVAGPQWSPYVTWALFMHRCPLSKLIKDPGEMVRQVPQEKYGGWLS